MKALKNYFLLSLSILYISCGSSSKKKKISVDSDANISNIDFTKSYDISSKKYGTETHMVVNDSTRILKTNSLPNHEIGVFPNPGNPNSIKAQDITYTFPLVPKLTGKSRWARQPGVAVNGIKFEPETAERFVCETGEVYRIEAFQDIVDFGLDENNAHVQPTGAYHYHGVPTELIKELDKGEDLILVGYATDGFAIYYSKSGKYKPSYKLGVTPRTGEVCEYKKPGFTTEKEINNTNPDGTFVSDWSYVKNSGDLDECNGIEIDGEYTYLLTDEYPYVGRCLKGEFVEHHGGGGSGPRPRGGGGSEGGGRPEGGRPGGPGGPGGPNGDRPEEEHSHGGGQ
ncbi:YHYH protein [Cellulophaga baltica]|uniref:YHYH protein n=1 Tax=Cellulophaga TaxID=104264 RepID=UPI001C06BD25|nr:MULTISPECIES: YHYH protein [Cellulophaga]MBU2997141.1 YHYH protein [Cellulophaga baltica]MDO6768539.1 YHYH protein [Cellulophaga sp. 1_MG-2023]